jgi:hypothetical protein
VLQVADGSGTWGFTRPRIVGEEINDILLGR